MAKIKATTRLPKAGPKGSDADVKGVLLAAGGALYRERGFDSVSLRDVAERAGVNQAMVRYYFKDKHGFLAALLDHGFERLFRAVALGGGAASIFKRVISGMNAMPWLPILMMRSVYASGELRTHFREKHAPKIVAILKETVKLRKGMDPAHAALSIISLLVFPQLARPVVGQVLGIRFDERFAKSFSTHIVKLFDARGATHE